MAARNLRLRIPGNLHYRWRSTVEKKAWSTSAVAAAYYVPVSVALTSLNKIILNKFPLLDPSFIVLGQALTALIAFLILAAAGRFSPPRPLQWSRKSLSIYAIFFVTYATTIISSLQALSRTSMLMCNTLRRTSMLFVVATHATIYRSWPSRCTVIATFFTLYGAFRAASADLRFDSQGYATVVFANVSSSLYLVLVRPVRDSLQFTNLQLQFCNTFCIAPVLIAALYASSGNILFHYMRDITFLLLFMLSCTLAIIITHATYVNTTVNDAVTQVVAAQVKDLILMLISYVAIDDASHRGDGHSIGVFLSFFGSLIYVYGKCFDGNEESGTQLETTADSVIERRPDDRVKAKVA